VLRSSAGRGGTARDDEKDITIDGLWRQCIAVRIAALAAASERAALQVFPSLATDSLPYYEALFGLPGDLSGTADERRAIAAARYTATAASAIPDVASALSALDARFGILATSYDESDTTVFGRAFEDFAASLPFGGGRKSSRVPMHSTEFIAYVVLELGSGVLPTPGEDRLLAAARLMLDEMLPAHNRHELATHSGFILDEGLLDLTAFGP
jgi:hypothetical protein